MPNFTEIKETFFGRMDVHMGGHTRPALLGRHWKVDLILKTKTCLWHQKTSERSRHESNMQFHLGNLLSAADASYFSVLLHPSLATSTWDLTPHAINMLLAILLINYCVVKSKMRPGIHNPKLGIPIPGINSTTLFIIALMTVYQTTNLYQS